VIDLDIRAGIDVGHRAWPLSAPRACLHRAPITVGRAGPFAVVDVAARRW
jgi:hypothetical protein